MWLVILLLADFFCLVLFFLGAAVVTVQLIEMEEKAGKYGWDSRYGRVYQQLLNKKLHLRHMLYHCYCKFHDPMAGELMDSFIFV